jgi:predicted nucleic acid-binding protein
MLPPILGSLGGNGNGRRNSENADPGMLPCCAVEGILRAVGKQMRIYLDNCCFNRPFDDQTQARIRIETEAKLEIQRRIRDRETDLAWSYMLDFENRGNPFDERREAISRWKTMAVADVVETDAILQRAQAIVKQGLRAGDALHVACAIASRCDYFLTTDELVLKRLRSFSEIAVMDPAQFVVEVR